MHSSAWCKPMNRTSFLVPPGTLTSAAKRLRFASPWVVSQLDPIEVTVKREGCARERFCSSETREAYVCDVVGAVGRLPVGEMTAMAGPENPGRRRNGTARTAIHRSPCAGGADNV